jgi:hypothetical protein
MNGLQVAILVCRENKRPPIPKSCPSGLKTLMKRCWAADPKKRPPFAEILALIERHKVKFTDTDDREVDHFLEKVKAGASRREVAAVSDLPPDLRAEDPEDIFAFSHRDASLPPFPCSGAASFQRDLDEIMPRITPDNVVKLFEWAARLFWGLGSASEMAFVLNLIVRLFKTDVKYLIECVKAQLHTKLPMHLDRKKELCELLLYVFTLGPRAVTAMMLAQIGEWVPIVPEEVLRLFNGYLSFKPALGHSRVAFETLCDKCAVFICCGRTNQYLRVLYTVISANPQFKVTYAEVISRTMREILARGDPECIDFTLTFLCSEPSLLDVFESAPFETFTATPSILNKALLLLDSCGDALRIPESSLRSLLVIGRENKAATYVLMSLCEKERNAANIAGIFPDWSNATLPTLGMTVKLLMVVLRHETCRGIVLSRGDRLLTLLCAMVKSGQVKLVIAIGAIIRKVGLRPEFIENCDRFGFFRDYYRFVCERLDPALVCDATVLTDLMARTKFSVQFLEMLPILARMINVQGWTTCVVSLVATLSSYREAAQALKELKFDQLMEPFRNDPKLEQYVAYLAWNLS